MNSREQLREESVDHWPTFPLRYTFNPEEVDGPGDVDPDELVVFDSSRPNQGDAWLSAGRGSYVTIEDIR